MRYLLLAVVLVVASVMLPMVVMPERPTGQPVEPVEIAVLPADTTAAMPADPVAMSGPAAAASEAPDVEPVAASPVPGMALGDLALNAASALPFASLAHMFDGPVDGDGDAPAPSGLAIVKTFLPETAVAGAAPLLDMSAAMAEAPAAAPAEELLATTPETPAASVQTVAEVPSEPLAPVDIEYGTLRLDPVGEPIVLAVLGEDTAPAAAPEAAIPGVAEADALAAAKAAATELAEDAPADDATDDLGRLKVTAALLNMRAGPSSSHAVVTGLAQGAVTEVTGQARNGWVPVRVPGTGQTGWVFSRYMTPVEGA